MFSMFKNVRHKKFDYVPRFYDPEKEELQARVSKYDKDQAQNTELVKDRIRSGFRSRVPNNQSIVKQATMKSNIRLLLIIGILVVLSVLLLQSEEITKVLQSFK